MRVAVLMVSCALAACGSSDVPHDMGLLVPDLTVTDLRAPRDGPMATVNIPSGCSMSPARRVSASSRW
jgi:hypothetical protein